MTAVVGCQSIDDVIDFENKKGVKLKKNFQKTPFLETRFLFIDEL